MPKVRVQALVVREGHTLMVKHRHERQEWWCLPGGGQELGETPEEGALRELKEECGLDGVILRKTTHSWHPSDSEAVTFLIDVGEQEPQLGADPEVDQGKQALVLADVQWLGLAEISERDRAFVWAAGLLSVPEFFTEVVSWGDQISLPKTS